MPTHFGLYDLACTPNLSNFGRIIIPKGQQQKKGDNAKKLPKSSWPFIFIVILSHFKKSHPPLTQSLQSSTDSTTPAHTTFICRPNDQQWGWFKVIMSFYKYILNSSLFENLFWGISRILWNSLKIPWNFKPFNPCLDMQLPWNMYPCPCLEIQGFSRSTSFSPWNFSVTLNLENFWTGHLDLDWTLNFKVNFKEPWNSRLWLSSLMRAQQTLKTFIVEKAWAPFFLQT